MEQWRRKIQWYIPPRKKMKKEKKKKGKKEEATSDGGVQNAHDAIDTPK